MTQKPRLLTPSQVVDRLAEAGIEVSEETVREWGRSGKLPVIKLPSGRFFFPSDEVEGFLTPNRAGAA